MSSTRTAAELLRAYYAALDTPNLDALDDLFEPDAASSFPGRVLRGDQVKHAMARTLATGLCMQHRIGHLVEQGDLAICELMATNTIGDQQFLVSGAVVCEAHNGRIHRLAAYPDANAMAPFLTALSVASRK